MKKIFYLINVRVLYEMATALVQILAEKNFVSIAIIRWKHTVAAVAGKGVVTPKNARKEAGTWIKWRQLGTGTGPIAQSRQLGTGPGAG